MPKLVPFDEYYDELVVLFNRLSYLAKQQQEANRQAAIDQETGERVKEWLREQRLKGTKSKLKKMFDNAKPRRELAPYQPGAATGLPPQLGWIRTESSIEPLPGFKAKSQGPHPVFLFANPDQSPFPGFQYNGNGVINVSLDNVFAFTAPYIDVTYPRVFVVGWDADAVNIAAMYAESKLRTTTSIPQNCTASIVGYHDVPDVTIFPGQITSSKLVGDEVWVEFPWMTGANTFFGQTGWEPIERYNYYKENPLVIKGGQNLPIWQWTCTGLDPVVEESFFEIIPIVLTNSKPSIQDPSAESNPPATIMKVESPAAELYYSANIERFVVYNNALYNVKYSGFEFPENETGEISLFWEFGFTGNVRLWP